MNSHDYAAHVAGLAAATILLVAEKARAKREPAPEGGGRRRAKPYAGPLVSRRDAKGLAYLRGQRRPQEPRDAAPLAPRERFARLATAFLASPGGLKSEKPRQEREPANRRFVFRRGAGRRGGCLAPTKSEARALIKKSLGLRSTSGIDFVAAA